MYKRKFVPLATAIDEIGDRESLIAALKDGALRARGRFVTENHDQAGDPDLIAVADWYECDLNHDGLALKGLATVESGPSFQVAYIDIEIERKGLEKLVAKRRSRRKAGQQPHPGRVAIEAELRRLVSTDEQHFKNKTALNRHLREWYEVTHEGDPPDPSRVHEWLREDEFWRVLISTRPPRST